MSLRDQAEQFSADKKQLNPNWKPETNIPANIIRVLGVSSTREKNQTGDEYAVLNLRVEVELNDDIATKNWAVTSEKLVDSLVEKGIDVGASFTVLAKGEGVNKKYELSNVVLKEKVAPVTATPMNATAPMSQGTAPSAPTAGATVA